MKTSRAKKTCTWRPARERTSLPHRRTAQPLPRQRSKATFRSLNNELSFITNESTRAKNDRRIVHDISEEGKKTRQYASLVSSVVLLQTALKIGFLFFLFKEIGSIFMFPFAITAFAKGGLRGRCLSLFVVLRGSFREALCKDCI